jgi:hypothetical protein
MQIAAAVTQSDTAAAKLLVPTGDPSLNLKPETTVPTCVPPQVLQNGVCTTVDEHRIRPQFMFVVAFNPAVSTYNLQFGYVGSGDPSGWDNLGSATVTAEEAQEDPEEAPAALAAAVKAVNQFEEIIGRLWDAKTYPPHATMVAVFRGAVQKALAEEDASVAAPYAVSQFVSKGYPAASGGSSTPPDTGSADPSQCGEPYTGPNIDPQFDTFCKNAYVNSCLDKKTGTSTFLSQTKTVCGVLDGLLKATNGPAASNYCSYCNPANMF